MKILNALQEDAGNNFSHLVPKKINRGSEGGGGTIYPGVKCPPLQPSCIPRGRLSPPLPQANIDYVHRDEICEIVCSILLRGIQKLQMTRLFSIPLPLIIMKAYMRVEGEDTLPQDRLSPTPPPHHHHHRQILTMFTETR